MTDKVFYPGQPRRAIVGDVIETVALAAGGQEEHDRQGGGCDRRTAGMRVGGLEKQVAAGNLSVFREKDAVIRVVATAGSSRRLGGRSWRHRRCRLDSGRHGEGKENGYHADKRGKNGWARHGCLSHEARPIGSAAATERASELRR